METGSRLHTEGPWTPNSSARLGPARDGRGLGTGGALLSWPVAAKMQAGHPGKAEGLSSAGQLLAAKGGMRTETVHRPDPTHRCL